MLTNQLNFEKAHQTWQYFIEKYYHLEQKIDCKTPDLLKYPIETDLTISLQQALEQGSWNHKIFQNEKLPYIALTLYKSQKITYHQLCTILERQQIINDFPLLNTYPILDENSEFTNEARKILLPALNRTEHFKSLTQEQESDLKMLIATLPVSERYFYTTQIGKFCDDNDVSLGNTVIDNDIGALLADRENKLLIHPSTGVFDALGLVRFGLDEYIKPLYAFGKQDMNDIENGVKLYVRLAALFFPNVEGYAKDIHDYDHITPLEATAHDKYHAIVMSAIPKLMLKALWYMVDVIRNTMRSNGNNQKNIWSKELWTLIDAEMRHCFLTFSSRGKNILTNEEITKLFCQTIASGNNPFEPYSCLVLKNEITPVFITMLLDMHQNPQSWQAYQIEPEYLILKFKDFYETIGKIYSEIKDDNQNLQLFKCQLYFSHLKSGKSSESFNAVLKVVNENNQDILNKMTLKKVINKDIQDKSFLPNRRNAVYLSYAGQKFPTETYNYFVKDYNIVLDEAKAHKNTFSSYGRLYGNVVRPVNSNMLPSVRLVNNNC